MDRVFVKRAFDRDALSEITRRLVLSIEIVDLPDGIVIQPQSGARPAFLQAFIRFRKRFIRCTAAVDNNAGPGAGLVAVPLPSGATHRGANQPRKKSDRKLGHQW